MLVGRAVTDGRDAGERRTVLPGTLPPVTEPVHPEAAFMALLDLRLDAAYRLAAVILGDRIEAEDAVHDATVTAWRGLGGLRDPARLDAWFMRIVVNGCRDRLRVRARRRVRDLGREIEESEHPLRGDATEDIARRESLAKALARLDADAQVLVALRFHRDRTVPEIAAMLDLPEGTVKSRLHHALRRLRERLEEAGDG